MTARRWEPGDCITGRNIWGGRVFTAWPFLVVEDRGDLLAAVMPAGARWMRPTDLDGNDIRLPHGPWRLREDVWRGHGLVRVFIGGAAHSVLVFLGDGDVRRWYVNLEAPFRRTAIGLDTRDHHLDIVLTPDLRTATWKDEDELDDAVAFGSMTADEAATVRAEAARALHWIRRGDHPAIDGRWRTWRPPPHWRAPSLAPGWEVPPAPSRRETS